MWQNSKHLGSTARGKFKNRLSSSLLPSNTNIELCEMFVVIYLWKYAKCIQLLCTTTENAVVTNE
jgi:hypothetical protein